MQFPGWGALSRRFCVLGGGEACELSRAWLPRVAAVPIPEALGSLGNDSSQDNRCVPWDRAPGGRCLWRPSARAAAGRASCGRQPQTASSM